MNSDDIFSYNELPVDNSRVSQSTSKGKSGGEYNPDILQSLESQLLSLEKNEDYSTYGISNMFRNTDLMGGRLIPRSFKKEMLLKQSSNPIILDLNGDPIDLDKLKQGSPKGCLNDLMQYGLPSLIALNLWLIVDQVIIQNQDVEAINVIVTSALVAYFIFWKRLQIGNNKDIEG